MASLSFQNNQGRRGWRIRFRDKTKRQRSIWLGDTAEHIARETFAHVGHLVDCVRDELPPSAVTVRWLASIDAKVRNKLATAGLCESVEQQHARDITLGAWIDTYIAERQDVAEGTRISFEKARDNLIDHFGKRKKLRSITKADAKRWRIWLAAHGNRRDKDRSTLAENTVRRRTGRAKQFFAEALERGYVDLNPFQGLPCTVGGNEENQFFVPAEWIEQCMEQCPNTEWRTILALCRYAGVRSPSEIAVLRWSDINLPEGRMMIDSPKTGLRVCPIFPELRPYLEAAWDSAADGAEFVCPSVKPKSNLRTTFTRIVKHAGLVPWPRLFHNLRASRETELMAHYPAKDVASWLGNSVPVAMRHYAMATADSFQQAIGGHTGGHIMGQNRSSAARTVDAKTREKPLLSAADDAREWQKVTPTGLEPVLPP